MALGSHHTLSLCSAATARCAAVLLALCCSAPHITPLTASAAKRGWRLWCSRALLAVLLCCGCAALRLHSSSIVSQQAAAGGASPLFICDGFVFCLFFAAGSTVFVALICCYATYCCTLLRRRRTESTVLYTAEQQYRVRRRTQQQSRVLFIPGTGTKQYVDSSRQHEASDACIRRTIDHTTYSAVLYTPTPGTQTVHCVKKKYTTYDVYT